MEEDGGGSRKDKKTAAVMRQSSLYNIMCTQNQFLKKSFTASLGTMRSSKM